MILLEAVFLELALEAAVARERRLRADGSYLVTGGLGGNADFDEVFANFDIDESELPE